MSEICSKMFIGRHVKYPSFLWDFNKSSIFSTNFRKILKKSNLTKIRPFGSLVVPWGQRYGQTGRQTDLTKLTVAFRNFVNVPKTTDTTRTGWSAKPADRNVTQKNQKINQISHNSVNQKKLSSIRKMRCQMIRLPIFFFKYPVIYFHWICCLHIQ
jgi:hypothetical protein